MAYSAVDLTDKVIQSMDEDGMYDHDEHATLGPFVKKCDLQGFKDALPQVDEHRLRTFLRNHVYDINYRDDKFVNAIIDFKKETEPAGVATFWLSIALCAAARSANLTLLRNLLAAGVDVNSTWGIQSACLLCVEMGSWRLERRLQCLELLLDQPGIEVNILDRYGHPIIYVAIGNDEEFVRLLLEKAGDRLLLDVLAKGETQTARAKIAVQYPHLTPLLDAIPSNKLALKMNRLLHLLWNDEEQKFIEQFRSIHVEDNCDLRLFLYWSTKKFLPAACKVVLDKVAAMKENPACSVHYTLRDYHLALWGFVLGGKGKPHNKIKVLEHYKRSMSPEAWHLQLNGQNHLAYSSIHYALKDGEKDVAQFFLARGANLLTRNRYGQRPLDDCSPEFLEKFLDSMIYNKGGICSLSVRKLRSPPAVGAEDFPQEMHSCQPYHEIEFLHEISKIPKLHYLLAHPVFTSFTFMKWHRVKSFYYANAIFYALFCFLLITYITLASTSISNPSNDKCQSNKNKDVVNSQVSTVFRTMTLLATFLLLAREMFQVLMKKREYFTNWENWLELGVIFLTLTVIFTDLCNIYGVYLHLSTILIILACFELFLLLGRHPRFSMKVEMLKKVTVSFAKFLDMLLFLVLTFALSFYVMFHSVGLSNSIHELDNNATNASEEEKMYAFRNQLSSVFKSMVMVSGEYDSEHIPFNAFPGTSHFLFLLFVFLSTVVVMNLLVGLAVSDVQQIREDAYLFSCEARVNFINVIEVTLLEMKRQGWEKYPGVKLLLQKVFVFSAKNYFHTLSVHYSEHDNVKWEFNGQSVWTFSVDKRTVNEMRTRRIRTNSDDGGEVISSTGSSSHSIADVERKLLCLYGRFQSLDEKLEGINEKLESVLSRNRKKSSS